MKHFEIHFQPDNKSVKIHQGATLLEAAGLAGIIIANPCGGTGRCGKCKVVLEPAGKEVLACKYTVEHDMVVTVPDTSRYYKQQILEHGISREVLAQPAVRKMVIETPPTDLRQLCEQLSESLKAPCETDIAAEIPAEAPLTAVLWQDPPAQHFRLIAVEPGDTTEHLYGIAVDIGTTSVVARLSNLNTAQDIAIVSAGNPQAQYGADVISRIGVGETDQGRDTLQQCIIDCLNDLIAEAAAKADIDTNTIYEMVIAGNTTMNHLLLRYPVKQLGQAPYAAHAVEATNTPANVLGLHINPAGNIHTLANIAGFVGSDTVAAALACGMDLCQTATLLVDIGTNGEIVCCSNGRLLAASCAAGPALEGAGIEFGSRAQPGAIERVIMNETDIDIDVIADIRAASICGSGLIDAVAVLLELHIVEATGRFTEPDGLDPFMPPNIRKRIISHNNAPAFVLAGDFSDQRWQHPVLLTQKDIRQFQLANAAIRAGITLLLKNAGLREHQLDQILLAGAFGNYIQKNNAVRAGLLPSIGLEKIHVVGNAAGSGAQMALINLLERKTADDLAQKIEYLEIAHQLEFQMVFSECLLFPEK